MAQKKKNKQTKQKMANLCPMKMLFYEKGLILDPGWDGSKGGGKGSKTQNKKKWQEISCYDNRVHIHVHVHLSGVG